MIIPHFSLRVSVALLSLLIALFGKYLTERAWGERIALVQLSWQFWDQLASDLRSNRTESRQWLALVLWTSVVTVLHFGGLASGQYTRFFWYDMMTHAMGGAGVGMGLALGLRNVVPPRTSAWWIVPAVLSVGAAFEVYEFVFRSFWYSWSLPFYARDTLLDIVVNTIGGVLVVVLLGEVGSRDYPYR
jgi:hypothetical protein